MPSAECLYIVRDRVLARGSARGLAPYSYVLCCPTCGIAAWGRIVHIGSSDSRKSGWRSFDSICPECPHGPSPWFPAGSLLPICRLYAASTGEDFRWEDNFPAEVTLREALLHLDYPLEKWITPGGTGTGRE
jgi:hypothetical protein